MKKTQIIEIFRMIRSTKAFCVTLAVVTALGIMAYTGISFATVSLKNSCEAYYDENNFYDLQFGSVYGFSDDTLEKIKENEHVADAKSSYYSQELVTIGADEYVAEFFTQTDDMNTPRLVSGRLPERDGECAAEQALLDRFGLKVGDKITLPTASDMLVGTEYTIVGSVDLVTVFATNDFYNRGTSDLGDGQVTTKIMVDDTAFIEDAVKQVCYVTVKDHGERGSDEYFSYVHSVRDELMTIVEESGQQEYEEKYNDYKQQIDDAQADYDQGTTDLADAQTQLEDAKTQLTDAQTELTDAQTQLEDAQTQLDDAQTQLTDAQTQLTDAQTQVDDYETQVEAYAAELVLYGIQQAFDPTYVALAAQLEAMKTELTEKQQELDDSQTELDEKQQELDANKQELDEKTQELEDKTKELEDSEQELADKTKELEDAGVKLEDARQDLEDMPESQTFSADINANPSYYYYTQTTHGTDTIVATLCTLLMGIAILVCFTTISRMVTEQHRIIGTQKAMGFLPHEIYGKYIIYVAICTFAGIVLGVAASYCFVEKLVYSMVYGSAFILQDFNPIISWPQTFMIAALEMTIMCLSAYLACRSMLKRNAIALLNSNIRDSRVSKGGGDSKLPLRVSMILRNLCSNPQILVTTLVSVMGCTILMISIFTVHHGMDGIAPRQFNELQHYQGTLTLNKDADEADLEAMREFIDGTDTVEFLPVMEKFVSYKTEDSTQYATLIGIDPSEDAKSFIEILDINTLEQMQIPEEGVLICKKMAENYGYSVGDEFIILDSMGGEYKTTVAGIFDRNIGMAIIVSPSYYAKLMDTDVDSCQYYVMGSADAITSFCEEARTYKAYCNYSDSEYYKAEMEFKVSCVNKVIVVVLVITGLLSLFVLFNLAQMNIRKKEKDIVVMKVLGFPPKRIRGYVFWEIMVMCTIGLIIGALVGGPLGSYLTKAVEMSNLQDIRGISISSCLLGSAVNLVFYTLTNLFSLTGIGKIKMTGSAREA